MPEKRQSWGCVILRLLCFLFDCNDKASEGPPHIRWNIVISGKRKVSGEFLMIQIVEDEFFVTKPLVVTSARGNAAAVQSVVFSSSNEAVLAVVDNGDGTAKASAVGPAGSAQLIVTADADLGEGVKNITGTLDVEVVAGDAAIIVIEAGAPQKQ